MKLISYYLAAITAFIIWGLLSLVLKPLHNYQSLDILFYRVFFSGILLFLINLLFRRKIIKADVNRLKKMTAIEKRRILLLTLSGGLLLTTNWFCFIYVMNHVSVKATSLAYLVCPIMTAVLANFILKERLTKWQWTAIGVSVISCLILSFNNLTDLLYSLVIAVTYALYLVSQRKNGELDRFFSLTIQILFAGLIILPFYPSFSAALPTEPMFYELVVLIALVFTILPLLLNLYALKEINSSTVGILLYINPIIAFMLAIFKYHEPINSTQIIAYSMILVAIALFNIHHLKRKRKELLI
ncbi:EamA family transporter [Flavobacterium sp. '19STA2R22 D10 B1']|uniref:EamA family transporter n=1 Tax=Flavobacterium aerium TaxID=3037261 RepID=UPI00278C6184|nr:EamA family transporter [Flavobacterium sp. '19STA2R22 D10 B1']